MIIQNTVYYGPTEDVVNPTKEFIKTIIYERMHLIGKW